MMTEELIPIASVALSLLLGAGFGALYFRLLWHAAQDLTGVRGKTQNGKQAGAGRAFFGFTMRLSLALGVLALAVAAGAEAAQLLAGGLGFVLARHHAVGRMKARE